MTAQRLRAETDRLLDRVTVWTPARWAVAVSGIGPGQPSSGSDDGCGTRPTGGDVVHRLAQRLADAAADAEGRARRPVPRLEHDLSLPDQLRVLVHDLATSGAADEVLDAAADDVAATRRALLAR